MASRRAFVHLRGPVRLVVLPDSDGQRTQLNNTICSELGKICIDSPEYLHELVQVSHSNFLEALYHNVAFFIISNSQRCA